ncbi:DUF2164 domain-containing protein [Brevundimonas sp. SORGH_AS_0993]|uniref:DUF2164 domain-containing protein n=1 Tax=Brevundimonas sp. SORGH_AS_0993 TaxID=3041794 RepID=UPI00277F0F40|nr:DUF2164 domain-containing protein [Brevundimonas sp. SORGH_AS_0993]MDQ1153761.1 uncharacterized protein (DUF2164 family) [Brevundimonas sp. SORGH_AS_0993]
MKAIRFSREETAAIAARLRPYFRDELEVDLRDLQAEMLVDFLAREIGVFFYNRALYDAQAVLKAKADDLAEAIAGLERGA